MFNLGLYCEFDICKQVLDTGECSGSFKRYYYNSITKQCDDFTYRGKKNYILECKCKN